MKRINSIDTTRGLVMVVMALDHVRDFMHTTSMSQDPTNLQTTTTLLFLTRWVTHLCAPTFVFLSGISAYISFKKHSNIKESRNFLLTRGLWLVILEVTFVNFSLWFDIHFRLIIMEVISAIGLSFIVLSLLLKVPSRIIGIAGIIIICCHNLIQGISFASNSPGIYLSSLLFRPNLIQLTPGFALFTAYPLVPWLGILLSGFACGEIFELSPEKRKKVFLRIGTGILFLFLLIRFINIYGDPAKWEVQKSNLFTILSFINVTKYPPSLLFTLLFTGVAFLTLFVSEKFRNWITEILTVYGKVPLFYFLLHLYIIHSLMFIMLYIQGFHSKDFLFGTFKNGRPDAAGGVELPLIYLIWIAVVAILYPVCKWYGKYKADNSNNKLLRYI
jgi:uncharacterized membrane protein